MLRAEQDALRVCVSGRRVDGLLRFRHHVVGVKMLAEVGVSGELGVAFLQVGVSRDGIHAQSVLPCAKLHIGNALAAQPFVGGKCCRK